MSRFRVFVTRHVYPRAIELLQSRTDVTYHDDRDGLPRDAFVEAIADQDAILCQLTDPIDAAVLAAGKRLSIVANIAVGHDNIDVAAATRRGILVTNTPGVLTESTADLTFALLMATARRLTEAERFLRSGAWRQWEIDLLSGHDVHGRTLGILGMGRIGSAVARRARGFGMRVLYFSRTRLLAEVEAELGVVWTSREELLHDADFVSLHLSLTEETRGWIGARELAAMGPDTILINTARGGVVDEEALIAALCDRRIAAAGLDVFAAEPAVDPRLLALDNVVLLPHIGSASVSTRARMCDVAAAQVIARAAGDLPAHVVNPDALDI